MARYTFGGGSGEFVVDRNFRAVSATAIECWLTEEGDDQTTDLLVGGNPAASVSSGVLGRVPTFQGPDGVSTLWASADGGSTRWRLDAIDDEAPSDAAVASLLSNPASATALAAVEAASATYGAPIAALEADVVTRATVEAAASTATGVSRHALALQVAPTSTTIFDDRYEAFPSLVRLPDGRLFCTWRSATDHLVFDGVIKGCWSSDMGRTWTTPVTLLDDAQDLRDPSVTLLADGTLIMSLFKHDGVKPQGMYVSTSDDDGETWSALTLTVQHFTDWNAVSAPIVELADGTLVLAFYGRNNSATYESSATLRSTDGGATWAFGGTMADGATLGASAQEPQIGLLADGTTLLGLIRGSNGQMYRTASTDGGLTWAATTNPYGSATARPTFVQTATGAIITVYRWSTNSNRAAARLSTDNGVSWTTNPVPITPEPGDMQYVGMVEVAPGVIAVAISEEGTAGTDATITFRYLLNGYGQTPLGDSTGSAASRALGAGAVTVFDDFKRADASNIESGGLSLSGHLWDNIRGVVKLLNGFAYWGSGLPAVAVVECRLADGEVTADLAFPSAASNVGLVLRAVDASNYLWVQFNTTGADLTLNKRDTAVDTVLATAAGVNARRDQWHPVRVSMRSDRIKVFLDGEKVIDYTLTAGELTKYGSATDHGLYLAVSSGRCRRWAFVAGGST